MIGERVRPIASGNDTGRPGSPAPRAGGSRESANGERRPPVVLVIDDERANLKLADIVLRSEGFEVKTATDAISAFEVLKTSEPDVIVMDVQLPGMDGWELTQRLKRNVATAHIPVVALTAYGTKGDEERARDVGCAAYFAKPVSTRELPGIIRKLLPPDRR